MHIKKTLVALAISSAVLSPHTMAQAGGVPTFDAAAIAQQVQQALADAQHYASVLDNWQQQIQAAQNQLSSITGVRNVVSMVNDIQRIYQNANDLYGVMSNPENLLNNGFDALSSDAQNIMNQYGVGDRCRNSASKDVTLQKICEGQIVANITLIERKQQLANQLNAVIAKLNTLATQASQSQDLKTSQDIANQIALAQASISALQLNFDIVKTDETNFSIALEEKQDQWRQSNNASTEATFTNPFASSGENGDQW